MKTIYQIFLLSLLIAFRMSGQLVEWTFALGGKEMDYCNSLVVDSDTSFIAVGTFQDTISFDPFSNDYNVAGLNNRPSLFIAKYRLDKKLIWIKTIDNATANLIKLDKHGDIFVSGEFSNNVDFDPGPGQFFLPNQRGDFLLKLDKDGNFIWAKNVVRGSNVSSVNDIHFDINEDIILTGNFRSPADFDPGPGVYEMSGLWERTSTFVSKLDKNGNFKWAGLFRNVDTGNYRNHGYQIHTDNNANIFIVGRFNGRVDFNPGPATFLGNNTSDYHTYIVKLSPDRQFLWAKFYPFYINEFAKNAFIVSPDESYFYLAGTFYNSINVVTTQGQNSLTSNGGLDFCIYKIDMSGDVHFIKQWGSSEYDAYTHIHFDKNSDLVLAGRTSGMLALDVNTNIVAQKPYENFICTFDVSDFSVKKAIAFTQASITTVVSTHANNILLCGIFRDVLETYDLPFILTSNGYNPDGFIMKISDCQTPLKEFINYTICKRESYDFFGEKLNESGTYTHTSKNLMGCDSIISQLNLVVLENTFSNEIIQSCYSYIWNNQTYSQSGSYTYQTINTNGCDSIATLDLTIFQSSVENISHTACDSYLWNDQTYTQSGSYTFQTINQYGCDSIISLDLIVNASYHETITHTTCDDYTWNGQTYNQSGVYTYDTVTQFGCDSILTLDLTINNTIYFSEAQTACDAYFWNNQTYTQSGAYTYQTINADGCDSIATLELTIFQSSDENISHTACDSYFWNNQTYTQSGVYTFQTTNQFGCDSIIFLDLIVNPSYQQTITHTTCDGYTWNGQTYNQSGVYTYATITQFGCDSILTLDLTINNTIYFSEAQTACDAYFWNNQTYTQSGSYTYQTINDDGCDSIATLELTIFESNSNNIFQSACQSFEYENQILTESGIYTFNLQNSFGCDSIVTLELEILEQFTSQSVSSCDQYIWPANGQTYLQSGVFTDTLKNVFGCDSVLQLDLNISPSFNILDQQEVCDQYLWTPNNTTYTQSGFYQLDLKTAQGCDSILTLDLTIHPAFIQIDTVTSTTEYTWQINNTTYATSGIYTEKWLTPADCDSIHQLLLTIKTDSDIYFPNIILPNSQNSNFTIFGSNSIELIQSLSIYDRWSNLVFHQENFPPNQASLGWNGKFRGQPVIPGVYVWTAQIKLSDGSTVIKSGDITVVE